MKQVIVLAMHGAPPNDFPPQETAELMELHMKLEHTRGAARAGLQQRHDELDARIRAWPRTPHNDPFWAGTQDLAEHLRQATELDVIVGFNEFCAPSLDEALDRAAKQSAGEVVVITTMMTRGGEHSEEDIPVAIERARERNAGVEFRYVWPFDASQVAQFLAAQITRLG